MFEKKETRINISFGNRSNYQKETVSFYFLNRKLWFSYFHSSQPLWHVKWSFWLENYFEEISCFNQLFISPCTGNWPKKSKNRKKHFLKVADRTADFRLLIFRENHAKLTCALEFGQFCRFRVHCLVPGGCHPIFRSVWHVTWFRK